MAGPFGNRPVGRGSKSLIELLLDGQMPATEPALGSPFGLGVSAFPSLGDLLNPGTDTPRTRTGWNARFEHWEKPASVTEGQSIDRAETLVRLAIAKNAWHNTERVTVHGQGSYYNNTNVRTEADIDLRVVHPTLLIEYGPGVIKEYADQAAGIAWLPGTIEQTLGKLRSEVASDLMFAFGKDCVDATGDKAIRLSGMTGGAEVDVVPVCRFQHISWLHALSRYDVLEGVAILSRSGGWTYNFPVQHTSNGVQKRARTQRRFKKVVRVFKRLGQDLINHGKLKAKVPSFLVESLVYEVEDCHFLVEADDFYDRVRRVAHRLRQLLIDPQAEAKMHEINGIKCLFHATQPWTRADALAFVEAVIAHLGDA